MGRRLAEIFTQPNWVEETLRADVDVLTQKINLRIATESTDTLKVLIPTQSPFLVSSLYYLPLPITHLALKNWQIGKTKKMLQKYYKRVEQSGASILRQLHVHYTGR